MVFNLVVYTNVFLVCEVNLKYLQRLMFLHFYPITQFFFLQYNDQSNIVEDILHNQT